MGIDAQPIKHVTEEMAFVSVFMENLFKHPWLQHAKFVFGVEGNSGYEGGHVTQMLEDRFGTERIFPLRVEDQRYGVKTSWSTKVDYANRTRCVMVNNQVQFMKGFVFSVLPDQFTTRRQRRNDIRDELFKQLKRFRATVKQAKTPFENTRVTFSGKTNENGEIIDTFNDDLFDVLSFAATWVPKLIARRMAHLTPEQYEELYRHE